MSKTMEERILNIISQNTIYSYDTIKSIYGETKSFDGTISITKVCGLCNITPSEILSWISQYTRKDMVRLSIAGLRGADVGKRLRETMQKLQGMEKE